MQRMRKSESDDGGGRRMTWNGVKHMGLNVVPCHAMHVMIDLI